MEYGKNQEIFLNLNQTNKDNKVFAKSLKNIYHTLTEDIGFANMQTVTENETANIQTQ